MHERFPSSALTDPVQETTSRVAFEVGVGDVTHTVQPLYEYRITGMVVSRRFSKNLAERRSDYLNMMDVGMIWGQNLEAEIYQNVKFHNNGVRLHWQWKDRATGGRLRGTQLSNNHLLCTDPELKQRIRALNRGDVIRLKGCLASYTGLGGGVRGSSVTRTDTGDGSCETVWVDELTVLRQGNPEWHLIHKAALAGLLIWLLAGVLWFLFA